MDESVFFQMRLGDPDVADSEFAPGLWATCSGWSRYTPQIQDLHSHLAEIDDWDENIIDDAVRGLDTQFTAFDQNLEPHMSFSLPNLAWNLSRGLGSVLFSLPSTLDTTATRPYYSTYISTPSASYEEQAVLRKSLQISRDGCLRYLEGILGARWGRGIIQHRGLCRHCVLLSTAWSSLNSHPSL